MESSSNFCKIIIICYFIKCIGSERNSLFGNRVDEKKSQLESKSHSYFSKSESIDIDIFASGITAAEAALLPDVAQIASLISNVKGSVNTIENCVNRIRKLITGRDLLRTHIKPLGEIKANYSVSETMMLPEAIVENDSDGEELTSRSGHHNSISSGNVASLVIFCASQISGAAAGLTTIANQIAPIATDLQTKAAALG